MTLILKPIEVLWFLFKEVLHQQGENIFTSDLVNEDTNLFLDFNERVKAGLTKH